MQEPQLKTLFGLYPALARIDRDLVVNAMNNSQAIELGAGTRIFHAPDPCQTFPFILSGRIRVYKPAPNGRELSLYTVGPGDACVVTAACLLGNEDYNASGIVKADCRVVMMPGPDFDRLMGEKIFREFIFSLFSRRVLNLMQLVEEVAFHKLDKRLAALLLKQGGTVAMSHQALADELGTVREIISRVLKSFSENGLISLGRAQIKILDEPGLREVAED